MFDTGRFLRDSFGSAAGLSAFLSSYGLTSPSAAAIQKWFQRETIPSEWLPALLVYMELDQGRPISLTPYIVGRQRG